MRLSLLRLLWRSRLLRLLTGRHLTAESIFRLHDPVHDVKVGPQIFKFDLMLKLELLDHFIELILRSADLLCKSIGTLLQVTTDITHLQPRLELHWGHERPRSAVVPTNS